MMNRINHRCMTHEKIDAIRCLGIIIPRAKIIVKLYFNRHDFFSTRYDSRKQLLR